MGTQRPKRKAKPATARKAARARAVSEADVASPTRYMALAWHLGRIADRDPNVRAARRLFGGITMSPREALTLLQSDAVRYLKAQDFADHGIPAVEHQATATAEPDPERRKVRVTVNWERAGETKSLTIDGPDMSLSEIETLPRLDLPIENGAGTPTFPGTLLRILWHHCPAIAKRYGWSEAEAVWFALTGLSPEIEPVSAKREVFRDADGTLLRARITLTIERFVPVQTVVKRLKSEQRRIDVEPRRETRTPAAVWLKPGETKREGLKPSRVVQFHSPPAREASLRTLGVFDWVEQHRASGEPDWRSLVDKWDRDGQWLWRLLARDRGHELKPEDWGYSGNVGRFKRDYSAGRRAVLGRDA